MATVGLPIRRWIAAFLCLAGVTLTAACASSLDEPGIHVLVVDGTINPVMERNIDRGIGDAEAAKAPLLIIQMDTPGGFDSSMRAIIKKSIGP